MSVTMKDIARDLSLSIVTVSKVLHQHPDIGDETRERVLKRMKELNYRPNLAARSLVTGRSFLVGLIVPDLLHPFFAEVAKALSTGLREKEFSLIIASAEEDSALEMREIEQMLGRRLDGLILASSSPSKKMFAQIEEQGTPYVLIDRQFSGMSANFVGTDDAAVGRLATNHLIDVGCKRIAHIRGPKTSPSLLRLEGYKKALEDAGRPFVAKYLVSEDRAVEADSHDYGWNAMGRLLELGTPPDGLFCYNDPVAIGAMDRIFAENKRIPEDIAVIGCGNLHYNGSLRVPLSSVDQKSAEMGARSGKLLMELIESKVSKKAVKLILEPAVVARASTKR